jgi:single-strand DNA-binding protein
MFETPITVCGNVLSEPEWRQTRDTKVSVLSFRVASTARRINRETNAWIDGDQLRLRVVCWRALAENAGKGLKLGDPVIIYGRLATRDWLDDSDQKRISYELEAYSIGHDMSRGVSTFVRRKPATGTSVVDDDASISAVRGERTDPLPEGPAQLHGGGDDEDSETAAVEDTALATVG